MDLLRQQSACLQAAQQQAKADVPRSAKARSDFGHFFRSAGDVERKHPTATARGVLLAQELCHASVVGRDSETSFLLQIKFFAESMLAQFPAPSATITGQGAP